VGCALPNRADTELTSLSCFISACSLFLCVDMASVNIRAKSSRTCWSLIKPLMCLNYNADLVRRTYANMMQRTEKGVGRHGCWIFKGCLARENLCRGPKPRQSVQYRTYPSQRSPLPKKSLDGHIFGYDYQEESI